VNDDRAHCLREAFAVCLNVPLERVPETTFEAIEWFQDYIALIEERFPVHVQVVDNGHLPRQWDDERWIAITMSPTGDLERNHAVAVHRDRVIADTAGRWLNCDGASRIALWGIRLRPVTA
jgi:hypothetical protein